MIRSTSRLIVVLVCLGLAVWLVACSQPATPTPPPAQSSNQDVSNPAGQQVSPTPSVNLDINQFSDIPTGFTADGYPYRGDPKAPVTIVEYSDYLCPYCKQHFDTALPGLMEDYVRSGKVQYVFRDFPIESLHPNAPQGHLAAWCVGKEDAARYWKMHDLLFATRDQWGPLPDPSGFLAQLAQEAGSDPAAYTACFQAHRYDATIDQGIKDAGTAGFNGTPSFKFISNVTGKEYSLVGANPLATFTSWIDPMAAGEAPPVAEPPERKLPYWATAEGLKPDPARPGYTMAGDAYRGNPDATVVVVEFSDFQCPACGTFVQQTQPQVDREYVSTGKVMWVFKHLPLRDHEQAPLAAVAAECAGDQGKFWEMHDRLFETVNTWAVPAADAALVKIATDMGLGSAAFETCLEGRPALERVLDDLYDSFDVGNNTPAFVIIHNGVGEVLLGAQPFNEFATNLNQALASASATVEPQ